jgi:hypothetical protein
MRVAATAAVALMALVAAASAQTAPARTPPSDYRKLTCSELAQEGRAISRQGFALSGLQAGAGGRDATDTAPATVKVWPSAPQLGDPQRAEHLAAAFRQMDEVERASVESQCSIRFERPPAS